MKRLAVGILAHVDAGKTTLTEGLLFCGGALRKLGRVDHRDAFLDTHDLERERGITIFAKQAVLPLGALELTLLDTPGHVDFSSETERTIQVLDCAILVVSGSDGVQGHTETLWRLLRRCRIPTLLFINKMDLAGTDQHALLGELKARLDDGCVDFDPEQARDTFLENVALCDEDALARHLEGGGLTDGDVAALVGGRRVFPCYFGSALALEGVNALLEGLGRWVPPPRYPAAFGARVYKISRDAQGGRLTWLKVTGGSLRVKSPLTNRQPGTPEEQVWEEKADQLRIYSGEKYQTTDEIPAGAVCAVTGLSRTYPGQGLGDERDDRPPALEPVLTYQVLLPQGCEPHQALSKLRLLEEEDPQLHLVWNEPLREIHVQLMGAVQLEVLGRILRTRFGLEADFGPGSILYRESIVGQVEGVGHYEPLRHYAEVHLVLEPGARGSGLRVTSTCGEDVLDRNWQRLILTHLGERVHPGVLTGAPITDMKITLAAGRGSLAHTEGGDFRQATYRAVRQGLMQAECLLLEPWYDFRLEVPAPLLGRAMSDVQRMCGTCAPAETAGGAALLTGSAPVATMGDYSTEVAAYTRGTGRLSCVLRGYEPCHDQDAAVAASGYDPQRDVENPADSIFCAHGAGFSVKWDKVAEHMHLERVLKPPPRAAEPPAPRRSTAYAGEQAQDKELQAIFERTYGPVKRRDFISPPPRVETAPERREIAERDPGPEYLLVDGYNIIFAWDELKSIAQGSLDAARQRLMDICSNYQGMRGCVVILVFDAYKVPRSLGEIAPYHNIFVVYTKEAETADAYIEKTTYQLGKRHRVRVATSDGVEQLIILGHGALRLSARAFHEEVAQAGGELATLLARNNRAPKAFPLKRAMEEAGQKRDATPGQAPKPRRKG